MFMPAAKPHLSDLRREIDEIDSALHDLLMRRTEIAERISTVKRKNTNKIRPGREARVLRRLIARHRGSFPKPVVARIWRDIMAALSELQAPLTVAVYAPEGASGLRSRARDHFGSLTPLTGFESELGVLRAVTEGQATIGVLPLPQSDDDDPWWRGLASDSRTTPRIVARLPFVSMDPSLGDEVEGLAVAMIPHEPSGLDRSFLVVETAEQVSRSALVDLLATADITVRNVKHWDGEPEQRLHLIEVEGFLAADDPRLDGLEGDGVALKCWVVGAYAVPLSAEELAPSRAQEKV
jgi:chorismate mutase